MKKISQKQIIEAIISEARAIKRKKELFKEAQKINQELKQLNEYGHPGAMLGFGFKNSNSPSPVMGLATSSPYEEMKPEECNDCKLDQFPKLEKDIEDIKNIEGDSFEDNLSESDDVETLKQENKELKEKINQIYETLNNLNEGFFGNVKAGLQGMKAGVKSAVQAGKEAGQQQYQQTKQSQQIEDTKQKAIKALQNKMAELNKSGQVYNFKRDIQSVLQPFGLQYSGKGKQIVPLAEGEEPMDMTEDELNEMFGKLGSMIGGAAKKIGNDIAGAANKAVGAVKQYGQNIAGAAQAAGQQYDVAQADKAATAQAQQQKMQQNAQINANMFNSAISALQNYQPTK